METTYYYLSLSNELHALKTRVKNFIDSNHPPTDGEWKESILRYMIRRYLPANIEVGRSFVVKHDGNSKQIDLLFYDNAKPILFRDGELIYEYTKLDCDSALLETLEDLYENVKYFYNRDEMQEPKKKIEGTKNI